MLDVPVELEQDKLIFEQPNIEETKAIFNELEFRRLTDNLIKTFAIASSKENVATKEVKSTPGQFDLFAIPGAGNTQEDTSDGYRTIGTTPHFYQLIDTPMSRKLLLDKLLMQQSVCFDTETTGLKALEVELIGIAFSWETGKGYYVSFPEDQKETQEIIEEFRLFFENESIEKIGHNIKYDIKVLSNYTIEVKETYSIL